MKHFDEVKNKKWEAQRDAGGYSNSKQMEVGDALAIGLKGMDVFNAYLVGK